ncbi:hypothetical protein SDC9_65645 [bioreactor metagenome]|uniref:Uncharacterized protein n=1 Tax=bioreactor metagenome TaxID=1076179 RepID=A0A644XTJ1_9ZZZZ
MNEKKKRWLNRGCLGRIAIVAVTVAAVLLLQSLPAWLSGKLLPALAESAGIAGLEANVTSLGLTRAELRNAKIRIGGKHAISVDSIRVHYSLPFYPFQRRIKIKSLVITGLRVNIVQENGQWSIPGLYPNLADDQPETDQPANIEEKKAGLVYLQRVILKDCEFRIRYNEALYTVPVSLNLNMPEINEPWQVRGSLQYSGDKFDMNGTLDRDSGEFEFNLKSSLRLANYTVFMPEMPQKRLFGNASFQGKATGRIDNAGEVRDLKAGLSFDRLSVGTAGFAVGVPEGKQFVIALLQTDRDRFEWSMDGIRLARPVLFELTESGGQIVRNGDEVTLGGKIGGSLKKQLWITRDLPLNHEFDFRWNLKEHAGNWNYRLAVTETGWENLVNMAFEKIVVSSEGHIGKGVVSSRNQVAVTPNLSLKAAGRTVRIAAPLLSGDIGFQDGRPTGVVKLHTDGVRVPEFKAATGALDVVLPLDPAATGSIDLAGAAFGDYKLDRVKYEIKRTDETLVLDGQILQSMLPLDCRNICTVSWRPEPEVDIRLNIAAKDKSVPMELGKLSSALKGMTFSGELGADANYHWTAGGQTGGCVAYLRDGRLAGGDGELAASGLDFRIAFPDFPNLNTDTLQRFGCKELKFQNFVFENIEAEFLLERNMAFLLESFSVGWCGGSVFTYSLHLAPGDRNVDVTIYFDGLNISRVINQTGLATAEGDGTIYGRLPLTVGSDGIHLRPGFLYSAPGETRNIKFKDLDGMLDSIPQGSAQYNQLDLASEALKNFNYDWFKVDLRSEGDKLILNSQFNGRPVDKLPFTYDAESGGLARAEGVQANFQGIRLDLNTSVPLNQLLRFNSQIQQLTGGKK